MLWPLCAATIDTQIAKTNKKLQNYDVRYKNAHTKLSKSAKEILEKKEKLLKLNKKLQALTQEYEIQQSTQETTQAKLDALHSAQSTLEEKKTHTNTELTRLLAKKLSLEIVLKLDAFNDKDALIRAHVFNAISRLTNQELSSMKKELEDLLSQEIKLTQEMDTLSSTIAAIDQKRLNILELTSKQKKNLEQLDAKRASYKKTLEEALERKANLRKTLEELNIVKQVQIQAAKDAQERAKKAAKAKASTTLSKTKIKNYTKGHEKVKTTRYTGTKTIAPLQSYTVLKSFGPYRDPIYNIDIFNESVSLKPSQKNAIVRSVLDGKIILSKNNSLLGNFVIIEHAQGLHTIYAHLDQMAPDIKQGQRVKKGSALGRVNEELMFEVTQKQFHINPMELIN